MEQIGSFALLLALALGIYSVVVSVLGARREKPLLQESGERAAIAVCLLITVATACLASLLLRDQFQVAAVSAHSNRALPLFYKFAALWSGQEGSLLFWSWLLSVYSLLVVVIYRRRQRAGLAGLMPYVTAVLMATQVFFLLLNNFAASPFSIWAEMSAGVPRLFLPADGSGLNPLLQYPLMVIHPPILYLGYIGFVVPFAFGMAALITRQKGEQWIYTTRRWTMVSWGFLTCGILLGARWAYAVLGWGGYWGWDPVENASLMPWLTGTAFLHSVMMQEKKGMMKVWNMVLVMATYFLVIFGTFLTRSGVVSSVHAFAQSAVGPFFATYITLGVAFSAAVLVSRLDYLKSENQLDSLLSRESSFLFNNLVLLAACFAVLWGTLFPVLSEAVQGVKITVGAPYFNKINIPIGLFLLFLTGVGPLLAWRKTSLESLKRNFVWPILIGGVATVVLATFGVRKLAPLVTLFLSVFVAATLMAEFYRGARVIRQKSQLGWVPSLVHLTRRNTRRYGGYIIHFGMVLMFLGFAGSAFKEEKQVEMAVGSAMEIRGFKLVCADIEQVDNANYAAGRAVIEVYQEGKLVDRLYPERRFYKASRQPTTEVAIRQRLNQDLYVVFSGMADNGRDIVLQAFVNPLVMWVWLGGFVVVLGTLTALLPNKAAEAIRAQAAEPAGRDRAPAGESEHALQA